MLIHPAHHLFLAAIQGDAQHFLRAFSGAVNGLLVFLRQASLRCLLITSR